jgi:hypothetical protein
VFQCPVLFGNSIASPKCNGKNLSEKETKQFLKGKGVRPTLTHGGMPFGTGYVLAKQLEAGESVKLHKHAKGFYISFCLQQM